MKRFIEIVIAVVVLVVLPLAAIAGPHGRGNVSFGMSFGSSRSESCSSISISTGNSSFQYSENRQVCQPVMFAPMVTGHWETRMVSKPHLFTITHPPKYENRWNEDRRIISVLVEPGWVEGPFWDGTYVLVPEQVWVP